MTEGTITADDIKKAHTPAAIVAGALILACAGYGAAALLLKRLNIEAPVKPPAAYALKYAFYLASAAAFAASRFFAAPGGGASPRDALRNMTKRSIVRSALAEIPALSGLTLFALTGFYADFLLMLAFSLALEAAYFPRLQAWRDRLNGEFPVAPGCAEES